MLFISFFRDLSKYILYTILRYRILCRYKKKIINIFYNKHVNRTFNGLYSKMSYLTKKSIKISYLYRISKMLNLIQDNKYTIIKKNLNIRKYTFFKLFKNQPRRCINITIINLFKIRIMKKKNKFKLILFYFMRLKFYYNQIYMFRDIFYFNFVIKRNTAFLQGVAGNNDLIFTATSTQFGFKKYKRYAKFITQFFVLLSIGYIYDNKIHKVKYRLKLSNFYNSRYVLKDIVFGLRGFRRKYILNLYERKKQARKIRRLRLFYNLKYMNFKKRLKICKFLKLRAWCGFIKILKIKKIYIKVLSHMANLNCLIFKHVRLYINRILKDCVRVPGRTNITRWVVEGYKFYRNGYIDNACQYNQLINYLAEVPLIYILGQQRLCSACYWYDKKRYINMWRISEYGGAVVDKRKVFRLPFSAKIPQLSFDLLHNFRNLSVVPNTEMSRVDYIKNLKVFFVLLESLHKKVLQVSIRRLYRKKKRCSHGLCINFEKFKKHANRQRLNENIGRFTRFCRKHYPLKVVNIEISQFVPWGGGCKLSKVRRKKVRVYKKSHINLKYFFREG